MHRFPYCLMTLPLLVLGCRSAEIGSARIDPGLAKFIPADSVMLSGVRMEALRTTPLYQKLLAQNRLREADDFAAQTGFDPRKDVEELLIASNGKNTVVLARGKFHLKGLENLKKSVYKGYTLYSSGEGALTLVDTATAVAGNVNAVRAALDQRKAGNESPAAAALLSKARAIRSENQLWGVAIRPPAGLFGNVFPDRSNLGNIDRMLRSLESSTVAVDLRSGLNAVADAQCKTETDAKSLSDTARGMVGLGRLSVPDDQPDLLRLWDGIKIDQQQRSIHIRAAIPVDLLDKLLKMTQSGSNGRRLQL